MPDASPPQDRPADTPPAEAERKGGFLRFLLLVALLAWAMRSFVVAPFSIPSASMLPTLYIGDYLLVAKWPYGYSQYSFPLGIPSFEGRLLSRTPRRGDVVVFRHPDGSIDLVKRVIGLAGDTVALEGGAVLLNGQPIQRVRLRPVAVPIGANSPCRAVPPAIPVTNTDTRPPTCLYPAWRETLPGGPSYVTLDQVDAGPADEFGPVTVPAGHVFLMGDNRDDSLDSRFDPATGGVGLVPIENLIGRGLVTFWSTDGSASYWNPISWFTALRGSRIGNGYSEPAR